MNEARGRTTIAFSGEFNPATPGMYSLTATFDAGAVSVNGVALDVETYPLHFYEAPVPPHSPELRAGQRFLDAAADRVNGVEGPPIVDPALVDASDKPIGRARIALHPLTLTHVDTSVSPHVLTFDAPNVGTLRLHSDADAGHLPGLVPLVNDAEAARLERAYAGRLVWTVGGSNLGCVSAGATVASGSVESDSAFAVDHVFRAAGLPTHFNGIGGFGGSDRSSAFITDDPIIVVLYPVGPTKFGGASYSNVGGAQPNLFDLRRDCVAFSARFADGWDFERSFRRASLENEHPDWDAATLAHIRTNEVRVGMTHEMIAWMLGYPPVFGTSTAVDRLEKWDYDNPAPFASTVYFRGDRVAAYDPPGFLP